MIWGLYILIAILFGVVGYAGWLLYGLLKMDFEIKDIDFDGDD